MTTSLGYDKALRAIAANKSQRYCEMDRLERYVETTQYEGLQDWFASGEGAKPLLERAPCIAYPIVAAAIASNADLLLGNGRYPSFQVEEPFESTGAESTSGEDSATEDDEWSDIEEGIANIEKQARLRAAAVEVFSAAQASRTGVSIYGHRNGRLFIDTVKAKWCAPEFDDDGNVSRLEIRYPYLDERKRTDGKIECRALLYRRVIDAQRDVTYLPAEADEHGREPKWVENEALSYAHGLGRCPAVWYAHMRGCAMVNDIDGKAIHETCLDEVFAHDVALSQRHRAVLMAGDPQWTEIGVDDTPVGSRGRTADVVMTTKLGGMPGMENPLTPGKFDMGSMNVPARKKGPGEIWKYPSPDVKVQMHTLPGDALTAIDNHARDLRIKIAESLAVVFLDPESIRFAASLSGKALATLKARQLDRVDKYRDDFGDGWLIPQLQGLLHVVRVHGAKLRLKGAAKVKDALDKMGGVPDFDLEWGEYFQPSPEDEEKLIAVADSARKAGFATLEMCIEKLRRTLGIDNVEKALHELEEERMKTAEESANRAVVEQKAIASLAGTVGGPRQRQPMNNDDAVGATGD